MTIRFINRARKDLHRLPPRIKAQLREAILSLADDPYRGIKLSGRWEGYRRLRSGDYRVVYRLYGDKLIIRYVRHCKEAYQ